MANELSEARKKEFENKIASSRKHFSQGQKLYQSKEYLKAIEEFNAALTLTPEVSEILEARRKAINDLIGIKLNDHYDMARKFYELGDYAAARAELNQALTLISKTSDQKSNP
jgi:tetratricopeptide (TPR) repeat protein